MLELNPRQKRQPFGGHHYVEYGITFRGDTKDDVVGKLREYRRINHLKIGDPDQDVLEFYLKNWPWLVRAKEAPAREPQPENYTLWRDWVQATWRKPPMKIISMRAAKDRWAVCANCPFNLKKNWDEDAECADVMRQAFMLRRGMACPENLGYCALHRADLSVLTIIDNPSEFSARLKDGGDYPKCWVGSLAGK